MNNSKEIQVRIKKQYGNERIFPVCARAKLLTRLTGRKTLYPKDLKVLGELGYEITYITEGRENEQV